MTHVVLANQDDDPNGSATPLPYSDRAHRGGLAGHRRT